MANTLKMIERTVSDDMKIDFKPMVIPDLILDDTILACNPERIIQEEKRKETCWKDCNWFSCSRKCRDNVVQK